MPLDRSFFNQPTCQVAQELLGRRLVFQGQTGLITETEVYAGLDDPASHAVRGRTPRTEVMFGPAGFSYVYLIYGMYHCLNIVTEAQDYPAAVLIRGLLLEDQAKTHLNGPGKLCRDLGITKAQNQIDMTKSPDFFIEDAGVTFPFQVTPRIGISKGQDKLWRYVAQV